MGFKEAQGTLHDGFSQSRIHQEEIDDQEKKILFRVEALSLGK